jgi:hypothetical protein
MKNELLVCLAFVFGIGFGLILAKPSAVGAAMRIGTPMKLVRVTKLHVMQGSGAVPIAGSVVGFFCSQNPDGSADCYIASQP